VTALLIALTLTAALGAAWWRLDLRWHPYARCRWCQGRRGRNPGSTGGRWGNCRRCGGSGERLRWTAKDERR